MSVAKPGQKRATVAKPKAGPAKGSKAQPTAVRQPAPDAGVILTDEQKRRRRARSLAIAGVLGFLVLLFYVVTIVKLGPNVLNRPL